MKKTVLICLLVLLAGLSIGFVVGDSLPALLGTSASASTPSAQRMALLSSPVPSVPLDRTDNALLRERADHTLEAIKAQDYHTLAAVVHPEKGVTFTPYSTVEPDSNQTFTPSQVSALAKDETVYVWGITDGIGDPLRMTPADYFARYVFNTDYTQAPLIGLDTIQSVGNAMENVFDCYPDARFVEFHYPSLDPKKEGYDWCSLKLVFEDYQGDWFLVGIIHSEWTV